MRNIALILPDLTSKQVNTLAQKWESAYSDYAGTVFDESVTGSEPFQWVLNTSLKSILTDMKIEVTDSQFSQLIACWGDLIPWPGTTETLQTVYNANFHIGTLSNGDENTLKNAMKIFQPYNVSFSYYFNSNFPNAGSFKPDSRMYHQLLQLTSYNPNEILHVAGANIDGWGSRNSGLFSALVNSPPYPQKPLPCFFLKNITDVPKVLGIEQKV